MRLSLSNAEVELASLQEQLRSEQREVNQLRSDVDKIADVETEMKRLNRDYSVVAGRYQELLKRWETLQSKKRLDPVTDKVQFNILEPPFSMEKPVAPNRPLLLIVVLVLAIGVGGAVAFGLNQLKPVFYRRRSVTQVTGLPVLGSVSMIMSPDDLTIRRRSTIAWASANLALLVVGGVIIVLAGPISEIIAWPYREWVPVSKIQDALRKLQGESGGPAKSADRSAKPTNRRLPATVIPVARKKKVDFDGVKHHLDEEQLIRRGLLAPLEQAIPVADEFRRIKRPLIDNALKVESGHEDHMNLIMVASALPGAGKTFCSVNLAASISLERELNVLLVDADVAKPHISTAFGLADKPGLIDILEDESLSIEDVLVRTDLNDIQVLPAGCKHSQSTELLASERMEQVMHELATRYNDRLIVMDSPPLTITSEAQAVARQAGQIVLVVESGKTTNSEINDALELLDQSKAINVILNKSLYSQKGGYYGGAYGSYGFNEEQ